MHGYYGTTGMWYKDGIFYELNDTHVNFFLQNPEKLGFTKEEKEKLCIENGLPADTLRCGESDQQRVNFLLEVMRRGAIRIRFYGGKTSVQCYDKNDKHCFEELKNCVLDGLGNCFGESMTVMDTKGWGDNINSYGWGTQIKDFVVSAKKKSSFRYCVDGNFISSGEEKNRDSLEKIFS